MMSSQYYLKRFIDAQEHSFADALNEIKRGRKQGHWMWFIFPQITGLGYSETAKYYGIKGLNEATIYLENPVLGPRLIEVSKALADIKGKTANQVFGNPDDLKLRSCMTLFSCVHNADQIFEKVLELYFGGAKDLKTIQLLQGKE